MTRISTTNENDLMQREDAIPGVDDAHVNYGENSHNDGIGQKPNST
jgi:hypothetical protein